MSRDLTDFEKSVFVVASSWLCLLGCVSFSGQMLPRQCGSLHSILARKFSLLLSKERKSLRRRHKSMIITLCHVEFIALATSSWVWGISIGLLLSVAEFPGSLFSWGPLCSQQTRMSLQDPYYGSYCNFLSGNLCKKDIKHAFHSDKRRQFNRFVFKACSH